MDKTHKKLNMIFAILVAAIAFFTYLAIVAPTVSFWDCGEYAATCHTLEVPHPTGNPLYIMMGRVVSMSLVFVKDMSYRINLITVVMDALMVMLVYLVIIRTLVGFLGIPDTLSKRITLYVGGFVGALFAAFSRTVLFASVEAEVNGPMLLPIILNTWLALVWAQSKDTKRDKILVLITFISFLSIGLHMTSMIALPCIFLFVMLVDKQKARDWRFWVTAICCGIIMYDTMVFVVTGGAIFLVALIASFIKGQHQQKWQFCLWLSTVAILGFSCNLYIPIRSNLNPMIDENHPATVQAFKDYMQRKQYGSETMVERMFWRRGTWSHQFGIDSNMGFGGFMLTQFFHLSPFDTSKSYFAENPMKGAGKLLLYCIPLGLMFFAWFYIYKKHRNTSILLVSLMFVNTAGLVFYMNFSDGTRSERQEYVQWANHGKQGPQPLVHREVRVRDYFWTAGFMFYGMWMGIAASLILMLLFTNKIKFLRTTLAPIVAILFCVSPALPFTQNVKDQSRRGNFVPFDYAYNLLMTCDKEGILFTNGDNDTFPLWALQQAYGIRKDVRIINLSLVNTAWYILQAKELDPKVPISYTSAQIEALIPELNPFTEPTPYTMPNAGITIVIPGRQQQNALRLQDKMVINIVDSNKWKKPIYFAVTVSEDNYMGLDPYLKMEGLVYKVMPTQVAQEDKIDIDKTVYLLDNVYRFRGLGDGTANLDETAQRLLSNYAACYIQVGLSMRKPLADLKNEVEALQKKNADVTKKALPEDVALLSTKQKEYEQKLSMTITKMDQCVSLMPWDWRPRMLRQELLMNHGRYSEAEKRAREALSIDPENVEYLKMLSQVLEFSGKSQEANSTLKKLVGSDPDPWNAYLSLAKNYEATQQYDSAELTIAEFAAAHPGDRRAVELINRYKQLQKGAVLAPVQSSGKKGK